MSNAALCEKVAGEVPRLTHFALELDLLAQVDELLCATHPLDVVIAVSDELSVERVRKGEGHCVRGFDLGGPRKSGHR